MAELLSLEAALAHVLERATPLDPEEVRIADAAGRVAAEDARATVDLPPFASSAMDGFAVRSEDTPGRLPVVARIAAGGAPPPPRQRGEATALAPAGALVDVLPAVADDEPSHRESLERGLGADVLVTSGGVSVGPHDLVRRVLAGLGVEEVFWGVAVKPGKPLAFGTRGSTLVFGLPGNPVSTLVGAELFVRPALLARQGAAQPGPVYLAGLLTSPIRRHDHRDQFVRARRRESDDGIVLEPGAGQDSHMIAPAATADALVLAPRGARELRAGESVRY